MARESCCGQCTLVFRHYLLACPHPPRPTGVSYVSMCPQQTWRTDLEADMKQAGRSWGELENTGHWPPRSSCACSWLSDRRRNQVKHDKMIYLSLPMMAHRMSRGNVSHFAWAWDRLRMGGATSLLGAALFFFFFFPWLLFFMPNTSVPLPLKAIPAELKLWDRTVSQ